MFRSFSLLYELICLLLIATVIVNAQTKVHIPDPAFKNYLNVLYPHVMDGDGFGGFGDSLIIDSAATVSGQFLCNTINLKDITGIEYFTGITQLLCYDNQLTFIPDLSGITGLDTLICSQNKITTLPNLSANLALSVLACDYNQLTSLPDLSANTNLVQFSCNDNQLSDLPDFSNHHSLTRIWCQNNKFDFSDARELRITDSISIMTDFMYAPQNPFGDTNIVDLYLGDTLVIAISRQDSALSYQWFKGMSLIGGATDTILIINNVNFSDSGIYTCKSYGTVLESPPMIWGSGISEFISEPFVVKISPPCLASFSYSEDSIPNGYRFTSESGPKVAFWNWSFGDTASGINDTSSLTNPTHIFSDTDIYNVCLITRDTGSCTDTFCTEISVIPPFVPPPCVAAFGWIEDSVPPYVFQFIDSSSGTIMSRKWYFGDGDSSINIKNPLHTYADTGSYTVCLQLIDSFNNNCNVCHNIFIANSLTYILESSSGDLIFNIFPNPFSGSTSIVLLSELDREKVTLDVFNHTGQHISKPYNDRVKSGQTLKIDFNANDLPIGVYFVIVRFGNGEAITKKMILVE